MRADACRNLDNLLQTGAKVLARDPSASIAHIAAEAGLDRRTVYRRFATREALLLALFEAKLDAAEQVLDEARLTEAPVAVALHRYVEGIVPVSRQWPMEFSSLESPDQGTEDRRQQLRGRIRAFVDRGIDEGFFRADVPREWVRKMLDDLVKLAAHSEPLMDPPKAADLVVEMLLKGAGCRTA
ncbi:TetR/AcrR family transcriptional regulator [Kibdelosporangium philippinense]|uniref:TetR/AcrR family transcriptional regulator n=1 Tax=Kibdelosporangium philippinense TaxID=211113 RepID=A0ABS8ZVS7_9PSEU|nr:TetR/AcrR family transcriptional regulator [Kibdelosporangium philippinense]MCE7011110.1 TetR/AcrR family transcriptional regulator [Kibdelosporangium philippinense]